MCLMVLPIKGTMMPFVDSAKEWDQLPLGHGISVLIHEVQHKKNDECRTIKITGADHVPLLLTRYIAGRLNDAMPSSA